MNENNQELLEGLRALAAEGPREAPLHIEEQLKAKFRKQNRRRHLAAWMPDRQCEIGEDIVQVRIEMADVARAMIAQEIIELRERAGNVLIAAPVDDIQPFAGVRVVKQQLMFLDLPRGHITRSRRRAERRH